MVREYIRLATILFAILLIGGSAHAEDEKLVASVQKDTITMHESAILTITAQGFEPDSAPQVPSIEGFDVMYRGQQIRGASHISIIVNGQQKVVKSQQSIAYQFELIPKKTGTFVVPSITVTANRNQYRTQPIRLTVTKESAESTRDVVLEVSLSKTNCYIEEPVVLEVTWRFSQNIESYALDIPFLPALKNVIIKDVEKDPQTIDYEKIQYNRTDIDFFEKTTELYNGIRYVVLRLQKIIIPGTSGAIEFEPAVLRTDILKGYQRRSDPYDDFGFGGFFQSRKPIIERRVVRSKPITLNVRPLPPKPAGYPDDISVGSYDLTVSASPRTVKVGEPVTTTVTVQGSGNMEAIPMPKLADKTGFRVFAEDAKSDISVTEQGVSGKKVFESVLIPNSDSVYRIPQFILYYFDPNKGDYSTVASPEIPITVNPAPESREPVIIGGEQEGTGKQDVRIIYRDLPGHIKYQPGNVVIAGAYVYTRWWYKLALVLPVLLNILLAGYMKRRRKLTEDTAYRRKIHARRKAESILKGAKKDAATGNVNGFYSQLVHALNEYMGGKFNLPAAGLTADAVTACLREQQCEPAIIDRIESLYQAADMARFMPASQHTPEHLQQHLKQTYDVIAQLEKKKW